MKQLSDMLARAGKTTVPLAFPDGSRLLVLPSAGRVLGLFPAEADENFLWTNPALATADSAKAYFVRDGWPNPGGDRTWLAPEIEFFIGDLSRAGETYRVPPELDPGTWQVDAGGPGLSLSQAAVLPLRQSGGTVHVRLGKRFLPAANPVQETMREKNSLQYAGYTQRTTLDLVSAKETKETVQVGLWNLLQLPQPGEMLIPTVIPAQPQVVFGTVAPSDLNAGPRLLRWVMNGTGGDAKIALKAGPLSGRAGYLYRLPAAAVWHLVVRQFKVEPAGEYVDALWTNPAERGFVFQACCVGSGRERFNELEYHVPAVSLADGRNRCVDESQVWAFRGSAAAVAAAARQLLGVEVAPPAET